MTANQDIISVQKLITHFDTIYKSINKTQVEKLENELLKMHPSHKSEVFISSDYSEEENSVGISIYISEPKTGNEKKPLAFDTLMQEYLIKADISKFKQVYECLELMSKKGNENYEVDFIPVFYNDELKDYYIHIRIIKK